MSNNKKSGEENATKDVIIVLQSNKKFTLQRIVKGTPTPGTLGDYWLLKEEYGRFDPTWKSLKPEQWRRVNFNDQFANHMLNHFGELHCEYCGKPDLIAFKWYDNKSYSVMSTVDHFLPKKDYPELTEDPSNLFISCYKCNNKKDRKILDESELKFRYDDSIRILFEFNETLSEDEAFKKKKQ